MEKEYTLTPEEYAEFLRYKKEKLLKQAELEAKNIEDQIAKILSEKKPSIEDALLHTTQFEDSIDSKKTTIGWRQILEKVFKSTSKYIGYAEIVEAVMEMPDLNIPIETARKSISSNLGTYSKGSNPRYKAKEEDGRKVYQLVR